MNKDIRPPPLEPFTDAEEAALGARLDGLAVSELESYLTSTRESLASRALEPTWRSRIEIGVRHAELALAKAIVAAERAAAAALRAEEAPVAPAPKTKRAAAAAAAAEES
jgi:hypothetical protein